MQSDPTTSTIGAMTRAARNPATGVTELADCPYTLGRLRCLAADYLAAGCAADRADAARLRRSARRLALEAMRRQSVTLREFLKSVA